MIADGFMRDVHIALSFALEIGSLRGRARRGWVED